MRRSVHVLQTKEQRKSNAWRREKPGLLSGQALYTAVPVQPTPAHNLLISRESNTGIQTAGAGSKTHLGRHIPPLKQKPTQMGFCTKETIKTIKINQSITNQSKTSRNNQKQQKLNHHQLSPTNTHTHYHSSRPPVSGPPVPQQNRAQAL